MPDFLLILDGVRDPGNLGTVLRTAAAAGVQAVLLAPGCADAWSPKVLRAGMGAHFRLPIHDLGLAGYQAHPEASLPAIYRSTWLILQEVSPTPRWIFALPWRSSWEGKQPGQEPRQYPWLICRCISPCRVAARA